MLTLGLAAVLPAAATADSTLAYGGGLLGITGDNSVETGVMTKPVTYLVFWGSQWGTESVDKNGLVTFPSTTDPKNAAKYMQNFLQGMGSQTPTGSKTYDGIVTQYCQGFYLAGVPEGAVKGDTTCPPGDPSDHVGYPTGGELAPSGVWYDGSAPAPGSATAEQIANEATAAAKHFGKTTEAQNLNAQYVIMSPTGTTPDQFDNGFCAWHDYTLHYTIGANTQNGGVATPYGNLAITNLPYVTDSQACAGDYTAGNGPRDPFSVIESHEYAETVTDPMPFSGWVGPNSEIGDACALPTNPAQPGVLRGIVSYSTGTFAVQGLWSNSDNACVVADPTVP